MLYPSIDKMLEKVESKYSLVVAAAKRARMLRDGAKCQLPSPKSHKYVGIALEEFDADLIKFERNQS
jgi:DNA-directed RNA polymerase subunit omega